MSLDYKERIRGAVYGTALGDAWGYITEFYKHKDIVNAMPDIPKRLVVSDDTQMSIYNIYAIQQALMGYDLTQVMTDEYVRNSVRVIFANAHVMFYNDPDNTRAPGMTCMTALENYMKAPFHITGSEGGDTNQSKGCGANMRATWIGLLPYDRATIASLAIIQAETTHGGDDAGISAAITALMVKDLADGVVTPSGDGDLIRHAINLLDSMKDGSMGWTPWKNYAPGIEELRLLMLEAIAVWDLFVHSDHYDDDMTTYFGGGWVADEALINALAATDFYHDQAIDGIERLVYTSGDSDSIAAIGGAFFGAAFGYDVFEEDITGSLEERYTYELMDVVDFLLEENAR
jgi:ADP-ribosylglycohydrolase